MFHFHLFRCYNHLPTVGGASGVVFVSVFCYWLKQSLYAHMHDYIFKDIYSHTNSAQDKCRVHILSVYTSTSLIRLRNFTQNCLIWVSNNNQINSKQNPQHRLQPFHHLLLLFAIVPVNTLFFTL